MQILNVIPFSIRNNSRHKYHNKVAAFALLVLISLLIKGSITSVRAADWEKIKALIGPGDSIIVADPAGRIIISKHARRKLVPASILKIFTSLETLHYLGSDYRYATEFYIDRNSNLKIKGYGRPYGP